MRLLYSFWTANERNAGTNANIEISHDGIDWRRTPDMGGDELEQNSICGRAVEWGPDLNTETQMQYLYVKADTAGGGNPPWKLALVVISELDPASGQGKCWVYSFNTWFSSADGLQHRSKLGFGLAD